VEPTYENLSAWFNAGAMCVGLGSQLFTKDILQQRNWDRLKQTVSQALDLAQKIKTNS
jgi:2-dehydro-3-deoxyphosphogluconate aldolase/(4S)-4-hydroxy-2-oxoglutarate aldolase